MNSTRHGWLITLLLLTACVQSEQEKAKWAEEKRIHCLNHLCEGDILPKSDTMNDEILKVNGMWFIGPREYFSGGMNGAHFDWWNHKPLSSFTKPPAEVQALARKGDGYNISIEIFLRGHDGVKHGPSGYQLLMQAASKGEVLSKTTPRPGLEIWHVKDESILGSVWYVATDHRKADGEPPVLWCSDHNPKTDFCTMAFILQPGISADMRFRATHGPDWPEIYGEMMRVFQLLRKA